MPIHTSSNHWILETDHTAYAFGLDSDGRLVNVYWGEHLMRPEDYPDRRLSSRLGVLQ